MGKTIIIKGADFSQVALRPRRLAWAFSFTDADLSQASSGKTFYRPDNIDDVCYAITAGVDKPLIGHTVRKVKLYCVRPGTLRLMRLDRESFTVDALQTLAVTETGICELDLQTPILVDATHTIGVGYTADAATNYLEGSAVGYSFDMVTLSTKTVGANACTFAIDYAY